MIFLKKRIETVKIGEKNFLKKSDKFFFKPKWKNSKRKIYSKKIFLLAVGRFKVEITFILASEQRKKNWNKVNAGKVFFRGRKIFSGKKNPKK